MDEQESGPLYSLARQSYERVCTYLVCINFEEFSNQIQYCQYKKLHAWPSQESWKIQNSIQSAMNLHLWIYDELGPPRKKRSGHRTYGNKYCEHCDQQVSKTTYYSFFSLVSWTIHRSRQLWSQIQLQSWEWLRMCNDHSYFRRHIYATMATFIMCPIIIMPPLPP